MESVAGGFLWSLCARVGVNTAPIMMIENAITITSVFLFILFHLLSWSVGCYFFLLACENQLSF